MKILTKNRIQTRKKRKKEIQKKRKRGRKYGHVVRFCDMLTFLKRGQRAVIFCGVITVIETRSLLQCLPFSVLGGVTMSGVIDRFMLGHRPTFKKNTALVLRWTYGLM